MDSESRNGKNTEIMIHGAHADLAPHRRYRGNGMVSGNNSSRLLMDYKHESPARYRELLMHLFGADGVEITHLKLEMGSDINSSSGTEPAVKRSAEERADVTRGAGYQLAKDAKEINPELTLDLLFWSDPRWVTDAADVYDARYQWYYETLVAAYEIFGLQFDYISVSRNERWIDPAWIKYCVRRLKAETRAPYDFSKIGIVAADEENSWHIAELMLDDAELRDAVDVIGSHYTSWGTDATEQLSGQYGKEIWFSEASAPMRYAKGTCRFDGSGLSGVNGMLDIANRMITMYPGGKMTLCEYQPAVSAYYDGVTYGHKQLITANEPWSGYYFLDSGYYMALHFSRFFKKGWAFLPEACIADGKAGGDGHALVDAVHSVMTAMNPETGDYSVMITNTTNAPLTYTFAVSALARADAPVSVWETRGPDQGAYDENYFRKIAVLSPHEENGICRFSVTVRPDSLVTLTTLAAAERPENQCKSAVLELPYQDDFTYRDYAPDYLSTRGGAPRYMTDQGGAFEVCEKDGQPVLMQKITQSLRAEEWGYTPEPTTSFGDDRWYQYRFAAEVGFGCAEAENYVGIGVRYALACIAQSGYWIQLFADGRWRLNRNDKTVREGRLGGFDPACRHHLALSAEDGTVTADVDGRNVVEYRETGAFLGAGRAALYSAYENNCFAKLLVEPIGDAPCIARYDNTDALCSYSGDWTHELMSGFRHYKRTISHGHTGAELKISFVGTGLLLTGENASSCVLSAAVDDRCVTAGDTLPHCGVGEVLYSCLGLSNGAHTAVLRVLDGEFSIDSVQIIGGADAES